MDKVNNFVVSLIRTYVPIAVGVVLTWLARKAGIVLDEGTGAMASVVAVAVISAVYYTLARAVEERFPVIGKILVALGFGSAPAYGKRVIPGRVMR
jgi:hypothetical protein